MVAEIQNGVTVWNRVGGAQFTPVQSGQEVMIHAYTTQGGGDDECRGAFACTTPPPGDDYPHLGTHKLFLQYPPRGDTKSRWTDKLDLAKNNPAKYVYLPFVMLHELGHLAGLGHVPFGEGFMGPYGIKWYSPLYLDSEDVYGIEEVAVQHSHGS